MAKLILGKVDYLEKIDRNSNLREFSDSQIEDMKLYYKNTTKKNSVQVNSILTAGREAASKIFIAN